MSESRALISAKTRAELDVVARFFGIDLELNSHIFRHAAQQDGQAFETTIRGLALAVQTDARFGTTDRIRRSIAQEKVKK